MEANKVNAGKNLDEIQIQIEGAASSINYSNKAVNRRFQMKLQKDRKSRQGARDLLTAKFSGKQTSQARARQAVECSLMPEKWQKCR